MQNDNITIDNQIGMIAGLQCHLIQKRGSNCQRWAKIQQWSLWDDNGDDNEDVNNNYFDDDYDTDDDEDAVGKHSKHSRIEDNEDVNDDLCNIQASIASLEDNEDDYEDVNDDLRDIQASIASYPEERGEGRRHSKRSARMDEQANNDEQMMKVWF